MNKRSHKIVTVGFGQTIGYSLQHVSGSGKTGEVADQGGDPY